MQHHAAVRDVGRRRVRLAEDRLRAGTGVRRGQIDDVVGPDRELVASLELARRTTRAAVDRLVATRFPDHETQDREQVKEEQAGQVNQLLYLIYALLALSVIVSLFGIVNTLALSIFERTRELGLLRAVGMTRPQVRSSIRWESVMIALFGTFFIMLILLAVLALIVVKALAESPWGTFTVAATMPIALFMGVYARYIRPGAIGEVSLIGFVLLMLSIIGGQYVQEIPALAVMFTLTGEQLTWILIAYGFIASVLPVWLLLAPRDYLSTFLKIGTIVGLAIGVIFISPALKMPAFTQFVDGSGPVWSGSLFPFLFITIACGAVSGFHSLISSGTTPKMIRNETDARFIGYGAMLMESFVAIMALIAASTLEPGVYFAMNSPAAIIGTTPESAAQTISQWGFHLTPEMVTQTARDVGEHTIISRTGGAPTLAVGMAQILSEFTGGKAMMAFWYHFAILFEALFILTAVDAGTRAGRFMLQDLLGTFIPSMKRTDSLVASLIATGICVSGWGYFLYQGVVDPLGGINTLWPLFGISNQMLAGIALILCTGVLFKMKLDRFAWVTIVPATWVLVCTLTAAWQKIFDANPRFGFLAHAGKYRDAVADGALLAPAKSLDQMQQVIFNDYVNASLAGLFMLVLISILFFGIRTVLHARATGRPTAKEAPFELLPVEAART